VPKLFPIVARHAFHDDVDTERVELTGQEQRVRVEAKGGQELAANGNDCRASERLHASQPAGVSQISPRITRLP